MKDLPPAAAGVPASDPAIRLLLAVLAAVAVARLVTLGAYPLFDDTEARYALIGLVMMQSGDWISPQLAVGVPFWAKPPLSVWGTALSLSVFGVNEFAVRLPSFLFVVLAGGLVYHLGKHWRGRATGLLAAIVFASCGLTFYLAGGVMTDPPLLLGITLTMAAYWRVVMAPPDAPAPGVWGYLFFAGTAISLLAKGPIGAILPGLAVFVWMLWQRRWRETFTRLPWISGTLLVLLLVVPWYIAAEMRTPGFLRYFIIGEHFERFTSMGWTGDLYGRARRHPHGTIWVFGILAMLPWSVLVLVAPFVKALRAALFSRDLLRDPWLSFLLIWHLTPLVFFTVPRGVLVTYVAMSLPAFALLIAYLIGQAGPAWQRRPQIAAMAALVPAAILVLSIALLLRIEAVVERLPNQAALVAAYDRESQGSAGARLVYVRHWPFSARFYSRNRAGHAPSAEDLARLVAEGGEGGRTWFAFRPHEFERLAPEMRGRLEPRGVHGGTLLARLRPPA